MPDLHLWVQANLTLVRGWLHCALNGTPTRDKLLETETNIARMTSTLGDSVPMGWLSTRLGLTTTEVRVLWLAIAHELCPQARTMLRQLSTETLADPTTDALRRAAYAPEDTRLAWSELTPQAALRRLRLLERTDGTGDVPAHRQTWRAADRVLDLVHGTIGIDPTLNDLVSETLPARGISDEDLVVNEDVRAQLSTAVARILERGSGLLVVQGAIGTGRRSLLMSMVDRPIVIEARALSTERQAAQRQLQTLARESSLLARPLLVRDLDEIVDRLDLVERELRDRVVLATATRPIARRWREPPRTIVVPPLTGAQRALLWARALPVSPLDAEALATRYPVAPAIIAGAARCALEHGRGKPFAPAHLTQGLRAVLDDRLAGLANRIEIRQSLQDLTLAEEVVSAFNALLARVCERRKVFEDWNFSAKVGRSIGVAALFSGPPGTGKTMAAGLLAKALNLELYQVDASRITSKWIGETEKNLGALFDAAEAGQAVLLFDEADALFGKRTDVKSSNDRHANQETNFLLQRLESFNGICILTSNHEDAIDEAFRRRLSAHIRFEMPSTAERVRLWETLVPAEAPLASHIDMRALASTYAMSGGYIRNAILRAAFEAASAGSEITSEHLFDAAEHEYGAMGRIASSHQ